MAVQHQSSTGPDYRRLPIARKQAIQRERMREPAVVCPVCETQTTAAGLLAHVDRCTGPREPNQHASWLTLAEVLAMGASRRTVFWWVSSGAVRTKGSWRGRRYLLRDVALLLARRRSKSAMHCTLEPGPSGLPRAQALDTASTP